MLVDEFQDTDPVQWEVLRLAFHDAATLVLIGDPKQAIYAFRGADVQAYLQAAELAEQRATLAQNWRSDPALLDGLDAVFRGAALGDPRIVVRPVSAAHSGRSLETEAAPVSVRLLPRDAGGLAVGPVRERTTRDVVRQIVAVLDEAPLLSPRDRSPARPVRPGDIAVIVRTNLQAGLVHRALLAAGVPSVLRTASSVFATQAAADWIVLLEALEQPHRTTRVRRLAVSPFVGWDAAALEHNDVDSLGLRLRGWARVHAERGIAALFETVSRDERLASRLLAQIEGERLLTDLRHVGEAVHAAAMSEQFGLTAALEWLRNRVRDAATDQSVERSRRLDSDAAAVQVVTVHASKGLEFPIVHVPFGWDRHVDSAKVPLFHDAGRATRAQRRRIQRTELRRRPATEQRRRVRRRPAAALRRDDPRAGTGHRVVGGEQHHRARAAAPTAVHRRSGGRHPRRRAPAERRERAAHGVDAGARRLPRRHRSIRHRRRTLAPQHNDVDRTRRCGARPHGRYRLAAHVLLSADRVGA